MCGKSIFKNIGKWGDLKNFVGFEKFNSWRFVSRARSPIDTKISISRNPPRVDTVRRWRTLHRSKVIKRIS